MTESVDRARTALASLLFWFVVAVLAYAFLVPFVWSLAFAVSRAVAVPVCVVLLVALYLVVKPRSV